ncbi:MAG: hypothetical protein ACTSV2_11865, partial [Candidatus Thorarchaeota archaeon]
MGINDITALERFRRVAKLNRVQTSDLTTDNVTEEICHLRSSLNAQFYRDREDWMLPYWAIKSKQMKTSPSAEVETFPNDQFRNWFIIGSPGAHYFGISDSHGLTTANTNCGSIDIWLAGADKILFPSLYGHDDPKMTLVSPEDQIYEWNEQLGSIVFNRLVYHVVDAEGNEFVYNEITLQNVALEAESITFFVAQRPMSVLGVEPIESIEYDIDSHLLFVNGQLALMTDEKPSSVIMTTADNPNLLETIQDTTNRIDGNYSSSRGNATCIMRFDVTLGPAGMKRLFIISPLDIVAKDEIVPSPDFSINARDATVNRWFKFAGKKLAGTYPDRELGMVLSQGKASLGIQAMSWIFSDESLTPSEIARVLVILLRTGCFDVVRQVVERISDDLETMDLSNPTSFSPYFWAFDQVNQILKEVVKNPSMFLFMKTIFLELLTAIKSIITPDITKPVVSDIPKEPESENVEITSEILNTEEAQLEIPEESVDSDIENTEGSVQEHVIEELEGPISSPELETPGNEPENLSSLTSHLWNLAALRAGMNQTKLFGDQEFGISLEETIEEYETYVFELFKDYSFVSKDLSVDELNDLVNLIGSSALLRLNDVGGKTLKSLAEMVASSNIKKGLLKYPEPIGKSSGHHALRIAHYFIHENERDIAEMILANTIKHISEFF